MTSCLQVAVGVFLAEERGNDEVVEMPYEALQKLRPMEILLRCKAKGATWLSHKKRQSSRTGHSPEGTYTPALRDVA